MIQKWGIWQGGVLSLSQAKPESKQFSLNQLSDADGLKISGKLTTAKANFSIASGITPPLRLSDFGASSVSLKPNIFHLTSHSSHFSCHHFLERLNHSG